MSKSKTVQIDHLTQDTISVYLAHEALYEAKKRGFNLANILKNAGIPIEVMNAPHARISVDHYAKLWIEIADQMNDEFFGMDQHAMRRGSYQLLSKMVMHNATLKTALEQILTFLNLILDDFQSALFTEEHYAYIVIDDKAESKRMFSYATYLMLVHGLMCWLTGQRVRLNRIDLKCNAPLDDQDYKVRFCENIYYQAYKNHIQFNVEWLNAPIKQSQHSWHAFIRQTPQNLLVRFKNPHALSTMIRNYLRSQHPSDWYELNELPQFLNISAATIQRHLKSEGSSYQQLKNEIRRDMAIDLLTHTEQSLREISNTLHFQDSSAFHRAFKKWTGLSPGAYRHQKNGQSKKMSEPKIKAT